MRTKTLLLAAALTAAGIASSLAQSNVYSVNVVGYVNVELPVGYSIIANPLDASNSGGNTVSNLFKALIETGGGASGSAVATWNGTGTVGNQYDDLLGAWGDPTKVLAPGEGFYFRNTTGSTKTNTFVGEVKQSPPTLTVPLPFVYNLVASPVPQTGFAVDLGVHQGDDDSIGLALPGGNGAVTSSQFDGLSQTWGNTLPGVVVDPVKGPTIKVGQGFFYRKNAGSPATFTRNFTVQ